MHRMTQIKRPTFSVLLEKMKGFIRAMTCAKDNDPSHSTYLNGRLAVAKDIDLIKLVKRVKKLKAATRLILKDYQLPLLKYASMNLITSSSHNTATTTPRTFLHRKKTMIPLKLKSHLKQAFKHIQHHSNSKLLQQLTDQLQIQELRYDDMLPSIPSIAIHIMDSPKPKH